MVVLGYAPVVSSYGVLLAMYSVAASRTWPYAVALPFFNRYGHPGGLWRLCHDRIAARPADRVDPHDLRCRAATEVMLGRYAEPAATYAGIVTAWADEQTDWVRDIVDEARVRSRLLRHDPAVVRDALTDTVHRQLAAVAILPRQSSIDW